jgi:hypothetical protein
MDIKQDLTERVENWAMLGHPSLLERFVLRNGKAYTPGKRIGHKRTPKECYANAANFVLRRSTKKPATYVEGFVISNKLPIPILHAWVSMSGDDAMDLTLDAENYQYFGVAFDTDTLRKEVIRNGVYGLLDTGLGLNWKLMFKVDPELDAICKAVIPDAKLKRMMERAK